MAQERISAEQAYEAVASTHNSTGDGLVPLSYNSAFACPHCEVFADHLWGVVREVTPFPAYNSIAVGRGYATIATGPLVVALCQACQKEVIFHSGKVIVPATTSAPAPAADMPPELSDDYAEAQRVLPVSPRGAAALLRLLVQNLLPLIGAQKDDINKMIGELVQKGPISKAIQQALDSVRVIGNEAVHPGTMDLKDDRQTATSLFHLINFIVEKAITEPKEVDAIFAGLPSGKLAGIVNRDKQKS